MEGKLRAISGALVGMVTFAGVALALSPSAPPSTFPSEVQAQQHCPSETVVWLNLPSGVYHYKGERWYGRTNNGAFGAEARPTKVAIELRGMGNSQAPVSGST
jgi:hypothetical protein